MADKKDAKKDDKKPAGNPAEEIFIGAFIAFVVIALVLRGISFFSTTTTENGVTSSYLETITGGPNGWLANTMHFLNVAMTIYVNFATIFSIVTFLAIIYVAWLTHKLFKDHAEKNQIIEVVDDLPSMQKQKWEKVLGHVNSENPAEWRLAILEADVILDEMTQSIGFRGETLGERLKNVSKGDFKTLDIAWEAHKIRNAIAHEGSDFLLSQRESKRVIGLYEQVFKEFSYV